MDPISLSRKKTAIVSTNSKSFRKDFESCKSDTTISSNNESRFRKRKKFRGKGRGVLYIGHIPHGFYEDEMRSYFNQFGKVRATTVARSKKTGRSRGYGFVEFDDEEVAKIAAETMNNYFMYNRVLRCRYIPPQERRGKIFPKTFIVGDYPRKKNRILSRNSKIKALLNCNQDTYQKKVEKKIHELKKFFDERNIDFNFKFSSKKSEVSNSNSEYTDGVNDQYGVLEIDESEQEISFKTPPKVKKIIKKKPKSPSASLKVVGNDNAQTEKKIKSKTLKKSGVKNTQKMKEIKKIRKTDSDFRRINQKNKSQSKKSKGKEKLLEKSKEIQNLNPSKNNISNALKQKNAKILRSNDLELVKEKKMPSKGQIPVRIKSPKTKQTIEIVI